MNQLRSNYFILGCLLGLIVVSGCFSGFRFTSLEGYKKTVASARTAIPVAVQIEETFGDADHFITEYGFAKGPRVWNTQAHFGGRYRLTMQVDVEVDYRAHQVRQVGEPKFYLLEAISVMNDDGVFHVKYNSRVKQRITLEEWNILYKHKGDLSAIGYPVKTGTLRYFDPLVRGIREERVHVSLLKPELNGRN